METNYDGAIRCMAEELLTGLSGKVSPQDMDRLSTAFEFAKEAHQAQKRKSGEPYRNSKEELRVRS